MINESVAYSTFDGNPIQSSFIRVAHKGSRCLGEKKKLKFAPGEKFRSETSAVKSAFKALTEKMAGASTGCHWCGGRESEGAENEDVTRAQRKRKQRSRF